MWRKPAHTLIVPAVVIALAGCGGSSSDMGDTMVRSMKGSVSELQAPGNPPTFTLTVPSAVAFHVTLGPGVTLPSGMQNGSQVQVKSSSSGNDIVATEVKLNGGERPDERPEDQHEFEVEGVVTSGSAARFMIGSQAVETSASTQFIGLAPADVVPGARVEAEGELDAQGVLHADKVKLEDDDEQEFEVEGVVTSGNAASFVVGSQAVVTSASTQFIGGAPADVVPGARVEAEGTLDAQGVLQAEKVKFEDQEEREVKVQGAVTSGNASSFMVGSLTVVTTASTRFDDGLPASIVPGAFVEVEGTLDAQGVLQADRVKFEEQEQREVKVEGVVTSGNASSFMVGSQPVVTSASTEFDHGSPASLVPGAHVEVEGTLDAQGVLHAEKVKFED